MWCLEGCTGGHVCGPAGNKAAREHQGPILVEAALSLVAITVDLPHCGLRSRTSTQVSPMMLHCPRQQSEPRAVAAFPCVLLVSVCSLPEPRPSAGQETRKRGLGQGAGAPAHNICHQRALKMAGAEPLPSLHPSLYLDADGALLAGYSLNGPHGSADPS